MSVFLKFLAFNINNFCICQGVYIAGYYYYTNFDLAYRYTFFLVKYIYISHFFLLDFHCEAFAQ